MVAPVISILYRGPGQSGCATSLRWVHAHGEPPIEYAGDHLTELQQGAPSRKITWRLDSGSVRLCVRHDWRSTPDASRPTDLDAPPELAALWRETERFLGMTNGVVFVADSQRDRLEANQKTLGALASDLASVGRSLEEIPVLFQLNKRDLPDCLPIDVLRDRLKTRSCAYVESIATAGTGIGEALVACIAMVLASSPLG